jgi:hypothetical protein
MVICEKRTVQSEQHNDIYVNSNVAQFDKITQAGASTVTGNPMLGVGHQCRSNYAHDESAFASIASRVGTPQNRYTKPQPDIDLLCPVL